MLYLISGAIAAGKSTVSRAVADKIPNLVLFEEDERFADTSEGRQSNLEYWISEALHHEENGCDAIFGSQSPLGGVLASPRAIELEGIAPCLLDVHDYARIDRWKKRGVHPDCPISMDHFCWAAFHRIHARDPQFEQHVLVDNNDDSTVSSRWTDWTSADPRWKVLICDTTDNDLATTIDVVADWVLRVRREGTPIMRNRIWWE